MTICPVHANLVPSNQFEPNPQPQVAMKLITAPFLILILLALDVHAQQGVTITGEHDPSPIDSLSDNRSILLKADGTWEWVTSTGSIMADVRDEHPAVRVVRQFLEAPTWKDQLGLIADSAETYPLLRDAASSFMGATPYTSIMLPDDPVESIGSRAEVVVIRQSTDGSPIRSPHYVVRTPSGWKVDWKSSTGHNPLSIETVAAIGSEGPVIMRLFTDRLGSSTCDGEEYIWFRLHDGSRIEKVYLRPSSNLGKWAANLLSDGKSHRVVVEIVRKPDLCDADPASISVLRVLATDTWVYDER